MLRPVRLAPDGSYAFMLKHKKSYLDYKMTYTKGAYKAYGLWLNKFEEKIGKEEGYVTGEDILKFKLWLVENFADKSVEYAMTILRNYFVYLKLNDIPCLNPALIRAPKGRANSYQAVAPDDYQKLLQSAKLLKSRNELYRIKVGLILRILAETGVRVSELTSILTANINLNKCGTQIENRKNQDRRWIYWSEQTNEVLKTYLAVRERLQLDIPALFVGDSNSNREIRAITPRSVERIVKICCKKAGINNIVPHSFRHGTAHNILERGGTVADVQKTLGHRSPLSSMKYLQYSDKEHERRSKLFFLNQPTISTFQPFDSKQELIYDEVNSGH